ncbi:anti-sigma factor [Alicyclobacillus tolerans]|uniref:Anti-sigma-W factor RsiW n=2 Tax=Alicyclobacillus tolerans TaxID=90970 RepID=A0A1M6SBW3_9BACL|nr:MULTISPECIES: anti-sigma factor [Alicyclobacillus]MDP9728676.1 hypothetical protein [Alicyclobacillus tengchongensis]SHK42119.1 Putative zinc-finger [Alicyclobacillus montanus]
MNEQQVCSLRELYVLDGLTKEERQMFEEHLTNCKECQNEISLLMPLKDWLLYDFEMAMPPKDMKQRVLKNVYDAIDNEEGTETVVLSSHQINDLKEITSVLPDQTSNDSDREKFGKINDGHRIPITSGFGKYRNRYRWFIPMTAAAVLFIVSGIVYYTENPVFQNRSQLTDRNPLGQMTEAIQLKATAQFNTTSGQALIENGQMGRSLFIHFSGLQPVYGSQVYQVWLIKKGQPPVSLGVFTPNSQGKAIFASLIPFNETFQTVGITLEPRAIDKTPKGPLVLLGSISV